MPFGLNKSAFNSDVLMYEGRNDVSGTELDEGYNNSKSALKGPNIISDFQRKAKLQFWSKVLFSWTPIKSCLLTKFLNVTFCHCLINQYLSKA